MWCTGRWSLWKSSQPWCRRHDCCAPGGTFWGIAAGISVMLLCFGPGVFFLFVERFQRLRPKETDATAAPRK